jgi:hypothetical protein
MLRSFRLRLGLCAILAVAVAAILSGATSAAVLTVCTAGPPTCQFATVSTAVAASADGDVILIGPGSFPGGFTITTTSTSSVPAPARRRSSAEALASRSLPGPT